MKKTNREIVIEKILNEGYDIGIYDKKLDTVNQQNLKKVLDNIKYQCDTMININRKKYIVEIDIIDNNEVDFNVLSLREYESRYGSFIED